MKKSNFQKAVRLLNKSAKCLITTHTRPDGDACGCLAAMSDVLTALGKKVKPLLLSPIPEWYGFLFTEKAPVLGRDITLDQLTKGEFGEFDLIIIIDTNSFSQLPQFDQYLKQTDKPVLVIDHHITSDGLGDVELVDSTAAAAGLIVLDLLKYACWPITEKIAQALFVAIATDTGWLQFTNTNSRVYRSCAELVDAGAKPTQLYHELYQNFSVPRFKLMLAMLGTLELQLDGRFATQHISRRDFERTGAADADTENLINECHRIGTVAVSALFIELKDGRIRCSLRSTCPIDVSKIASKFGGGGHPAAAGTYLPGPLENAKQLILTEVTEQFRRLDAG
ncbi:MAG: bifunctional oligoribonuclease/PAP phosphatase NrnA [Planctomycetota bacterium]|nr:bifunctional oligoribonuclease/PAP phosphatase NrnA [Planctomycetota bacterium]